MLRRRDSAVSKHEGPYPSFETRAMRAPQDEDFLRGEIANRHGEEACNAVSNHEARDGRVQQNPVWERGSS